MAREPGAKSPAGCARTLGGGVRRAPPTDGGRRRATTATGAAETHGADGLADGTTLRSQAATISRATTGRRDAEGCCWEMIGARMRATFGARWPRSWLVAAGRPRAAAGRCRHL